MKETRNCRVGRRGHARIKRDIVLWLGAGHGCKRFFVAEGEEEDKGGERGDNGIKIALRGVPEIDGMKRQRRVGG